MLYHFQSAFYGRALGSTPQAENLVFANQARKPVEPEGCKMLG